MPTINEELLAACTMTGTGFSLQKVNDLLSQGADINTRDDNGNTPLHLAVQNQNPISKELISLLFNSGANYKCKNINGKLAHEAGSILTPVHRQSMVLLQSLIDKNECDKEQQLLKFQQISLNTMQEQTKLLLEIKNQIQQLKEEVQQVKNQVENKELSKHSSSQGFFS